jgi:hypothetical protein
MRNLKWPVTLVNSKELLKRHEIEFDERYVWDWAARSGLDFLGIPLPRASPEAADNRRLRRYPR